MTPLRNDDVTAGCGVCGKEIAGTGRTWCSDACRQAAWRRRHLPAREIPELPPTRSKRKATVYECPDCGNREVGVQRCEDCNIFMTKVGAGGVCPCCDEPVTIDELLET